MLADCFPIEFNAGRRESVLTDGSRIVFIPGKPNRWLAINAMGVRIGDDYSSESLAQSALNDQIVTTPEPPRRARCSHCRSGYHTVADCPVKAAEGERIAAKRKAKESHGKHEDEAPVPEPVRGGEVTPDYLSAVRRLDTGKGVTAFDVHSELGLGSDAVSTRHRLDLLVDVGRLTRTRTGHKAARYRVASPKPPALVLPTGEWPLPDHLPGLPDQPPTPPEILDPDVLRPEDPAECRECPVTGGRCEIPSTGCRDCGRGPDDSEPEFTMEEIREHLPDGGYAFDHDDDDPDASDPWDSWLPDVRQSAADVSTEPVALTPIRAQQIIRREQRLRSTRDERSTELREAVRVLRELADVGEGLIGEVGR